MGSDSEGSSGRPDPTDWHPPGDRDRYQPGGGGSGGGNQGPYPSSVPGGQGGYPGGKYKKSRSFT